MDSNLEHDAARSLSSRLYETEADLQQMYSLLMEARSQTNDWRYGHVGELAFSFFMIDCHLDPRRHVRLWHDGEKLVGYALLGESSAFDWELLPEYEGWGVEEEALAWADGLVAELRSEDAERWKGPLAVGNGRSCSAGDQG